jgi:hypothetical protein
MTMRPPPWGVDVVRKALSGKRFPDPTDALHPDARPDTTDDGPAGRSLSERCGVPCL